MSNAARRDASVAEGGNLILIRALRLSRAEKEIPMVVIRNVFHLKFGKAREAVALMKEGLALQKKVLAGEAYSTRLLTDVTGQNYTLVLELSVANLATYEANAPKLFANKDWQAHYQKIVPLVESGHRDIYTVVD
jgi:hypothetical protein